LPSFTATATPGTNFAPALEKMVPYLLDLINHYRAD